MKQNRILTHFFIVIGIAILLCSCSQEKKIKVGYLYPSESFPRFLKEGAFMAERLKELGVQTIAMHGNDDEALQIQNGIKLLNKGVDMLIITAVNGGTIAPLVREAHKRGVPVMAYNRLISNVDYEIYFTGDNDNIGSIFCDAALMLKPKGNYVILAGDRFDRNGVELKHAIDSLLAPHVTSGNVNIMYESYIENWNKELAGKELEQVIESYGPNIDAVIACSDPMADGCKTTLAKYGLLGNVVVTGQDADLYAIKSIYEGTQTVTVFHPYKTLGYRAADLAMDIIKGKKLKSLTNGSTFNGLTEIPTLKVKSVAINKSNIEKELVETGAYTWDQIMASN